MVTAQDLKNSNITIKSQGEPITSVFKKITKASNYNFFYDESVVFNISLVNINKSNSSLQSILDELSKQTGLKFIISDNTITVVSKDTHEKQVPKSAVLKSQISIKGVVTDRNGEPLIGVSVVLKNATKGTITDIGGNFNFDNVSADGTIVLSYLGFRTQEIAINGKTSHKVVLEEEIKQLDAVVVVGYGTQKKANLTGAVTQINSDELKDRPVANVTQALQGKMPNVNITFSGGEPGAGGSVNVRGLTSINGGGPLVLVDGVPSDMNRVNSNDIESISVLKDAAASAIYGARGAFGVILITTKNGKEGKMRISYDNFFASSSPTSRTDFMTNGYESVKLNDEAMRRSKGTTYTRYSDDDMAELEARRYDKREHPDRPWIVVKDFKGKDIYNYYGNYDWWDTMFTKHQFSQSHNINVSGGNDKLNFMLSGNMYMKDGMMKINNDKFQSFNFRSKISAQILPMLRITNNTQYYDKEFTYYGKDGGGNANFTNITMHALPAYAPMNPDGTSTYRTSKNGYTIGDGLFALLADGKSKGQKGVHEMRTTTGIELKPIDKLTINADYTYTHYVADDWYRSTVIKYSIEPGKLEDVANYNTDKYRKTMWFDPMHVANAFATYSDTYGKHNFSVMGGMNYEKKKHERIMASQQNLVSETLNDLQLGTGDMEVGGGSYEYALLGVFFRTNYNYADRYLLEVNGRYDGTSRYQKGNRYGFFPSFSGAWRVSEEAFWTDLRNSVNNLKFRLSYGELGNQLLGSSTSSNSYYPYIPLMGMGLNNWIIGNSKTQYVNAPGAVTSTLTWEKAATTNIGLDFSVLNNRLSFTGDIYRRDTKDMLTAGETLPAVFGTASPLQNAGDLRTQGYEFTISWQDKFTLAGKPFIYDVSFALGDSKSKITKFNNPTGILSNNYKGKEWGEIWGYKVDGYFATDAEAAAWDVDQRQVGDNIYNASGEWARLRAGDMKFVDIDGSKRIDKGKNTIDDHGDLVKIGNSQARYNYGFGTNMKWNNFDVSIFFQGVGKRDWYPGVNADKFWGPYSRPYYSFIPKNFTDLVWSEDNKDAYFPTLRTYTALSSTGAMGQPNDKYLQSIAYLRLKNLVIGYTLPQSLLSKIRIHNCRVYLSADNLVTWSAMDTDYIDPEQPVADSNGRTYPIAKTVAVGLNITF